MLSILFGIMLAVHLGPMGPDTPAREPQMAANGSFVALTFGAGNSIYFSASHDAGRTFSTPVKVAEADVLPLSRHRGPHIAISGETIVISAVAGRTLSQGAHAHGLPSDGDLLAWRSIDGGQHWSKGIRVNDVPGAPTEGLHALAANDSGMFFAAWLDKRTGKGTQLRGARSTDGGATWSENIVIYQSPEGTICECCHPSAAIGSNGEILVMWRNWLDGSRDMYLARARDGLAFSKAEKLGTGTWRLNACPMDGGGLVISGNRVVTAWRRDRQVYLASPGETETEIGEGSDVAIASGQPGTYAIWSASTGVRALLPGKEVIALAPKGTFPTVVSLPGASALAAWEDGGRIVIQQVP
jgi:hypothetical protein